MLKNNKERLDYIRDEKNWIKVEYLPMREIEPSGNYPFIAALKLKGTTIYKIQALTYNPYQGTHYVTLGCYLYKPSGLLENIYSFSDTQIVTYLREEKI